MTMKLRFPKEAGRIGFWAITIGRASQAESAPIKPASDRKWVAPSIARLIDDYEAALPEGGWPNWVLGNHDRPRIASRVGSDQARIRSEMGGALDRTVDR